jgi:hypothetical protein
LRSFLTISELGVNDDVNNDAKNYVNAINDAGNDACDCVSVNDDANDE